MPKKINFKRFKAVLYASIKGYQVRKAFRVLNSQHDVREAMDLIRLRNDLVSKGKTKDLFYN